MQDIKLFQSQNDDEKFSLSELIKNQTSQRDQIYRLLDEGEKFRYVSLKIKAISVASESTIEKSEPFLVQIIDLSHKMFYSEIKERESILQLINATVSHELRNPLTAIINQVTQLKMFLGFLASLIEVLKKHRGLKHLIERLQQLHEGLNSSCDRISFASQFIDFFVHDMLDYAVL